MTLLSPLPAEEQTGWLSCLYILWQINSFFGWIHSKSARWRLRASYIVISAHIFYLNKIPLKNRGWNRL